MLIHTLLYLQYYLCYYTPCHASVSYVLTFYLLISTLDIYTYPPPHYLPSPNPPTTSPPTHLPILQHAKMPRSSPALDAGSFSPLCVRLTCRLRRSRIRKEDGCIAGRTRSKSSLSSSPSPSPQKKGSKTPAITPKNGVLKMKRVTKKNRLQATNQNDEEVKDDAGHLLYSVSQRIRHLDMENTPLKPSGKSWKSEEKMKERREKRMVRVEVEVPQEMKRMVAAEESQPTKRTRLWV
jgi:hypothetical protein